MLAGHQFGACLPTFGSCADRYCLSGYGGGGTTMEEMLDLNNQIVQKLMNGTAITQDEKDAFNLAVNTCAPKFKLLLANVTQTVADAMLAKKSAARDIETAIKNDPEWPY